MTEDNDEPERSPGEIGTGEQKPGIGQPLRQSLLAFLSLE
ncbi:hypothetical protein NSTC745_05875 [Nostoc sp. DSM 114161]